MNDKAASYIRKGIEKFENNDYQDAIADYQKAVEIEPDNYIAYYQWGLAAHNILSENWKLFDDSVDESIVDIKEKFHKVIDITTEIIKNNPQDANALLYRENAKVALIKAVFTIADWQKSIRI